MPTTPAIPRFILKDAALGLAQQMVWWGHDVRHPAGNALVRYGLKRTPSLGLSGTSCYSVLWQDGLVELHGAVASWTAPAGGNGCIYHRDLRRIDLWRGENAPIPGQDFGESGPTDERWQALQPLLTWLIGYEEWVLETLGPGWRAGCARALKKLPMGKPWLPPSKALQWWRLAIQSPCPPRPRDILKF